MTKKILIVTADFKKAYPIIKSVAKSGYKPIIVFHRIWSWPIFSRYASKRYRIANPYKNEKKYAFQVLKVAEKENVDMIIPVGYIDNVVLAKYRNIFRNFTIPISSYDAILKVSNKAELGKVLSKIGIKYPNTTTLSQENKDIEKLNFPLVVKGIWDASTPEYVFNEHFFSTLKLGKEQKLILQEFIPGYGNGYFALAKNGEVFLEFCHKRVIEMHPSGGPSIVACAYYDSNLLEIGRKIVKELKWSGVIMAEFKRDYETGEYYLIEINPKFWGSLELATTYGADFVKCLIKLFGENRRLKKKTFGKKNYCFSWILSGSHYVVENYKVWAKMVYYGLKYGIFSTDIHITDPPELLVSSAIALLRMFRHKKKASKRKKILQERAKKVFLRSITSMGIDGIFFDLDGTLVDLSVDWNKIKDKLAKRGLMKRSDSLIMALHKAKNTNSELFEELNKFIEQYEIEFARKITPRPELITLLKEIKKHNIKLGVVSKQSKDVITLALERLNILEFFDVIVGREDETLRNKQLSLALDKTKVPAKNALLIGDALTDATTASKQRIIPILVSKKPYEIQRFFELGVPCFSSVEAVLKTIIKLKKW
ncbi:MAG: HAD-IA family hydrolase [Candidatus Odinarchaeota archaeon]|nr:HAD-IA family hydrolase [Candidatus Odinarchaeota archaeon]